MGCTNCGNNGANYSSGERVNVGDTLDISAINFVLPVDELPPAMVGSRQHMYITKSDQVFILNHSGKEWIELSGVLQDTPIENVEPREMLEP